MKYLETDVLVIGAGASGSMAAIRASEFNVNVTVLEKAVLRTDKAVKLRNRHIEGTLTLMAQDLIVYEVVNTMTYHPEISDEAIRENIEALFMIDLELVPPSTELVASIADRARQLAISTYDSSYLVLAEITATNLVTADKKFYDRVKDTKQVLILEELDRKWIV